MSLRQQANRDLSAILEDSCGFGWPIVVTDPDGTKARVMGQANNIGEGIDPETGQIVSGQSVEVVLTLASLVAMGLGIPKAIADGKRKPWAVEFADICGASHSYKVAESRVDHTLGAVRCVLENYKS